MIAASSRSGALPSGRWRLPPSARRSCQTRIWLKRKRASISLATRASVHSPVAYPSASGPVFKARSRLCSSRAAGDSRWVAEQVGCGNDYRHKNAERHTLFRITMGISLPGLSSCEAWTEPRARRRRLSRGARTVTGISSTNSLPQRRYTRGARPRPDLAPGREGRLIRRLFACRGSSRLGNGCCRRWPRNPRWTCETELGACRRGGASTGEQGHSGKGGSTQNSGGPGAGGLFSWKA
jgi:hypothetical protein